MRERLRLLPLLQGVVTLKDFRTGVLFISGIPRPQGSKRHVGNGVMIESSKHVKKWRTDCCHRDGDQGPNERIIDVGHNLCLTNYGLILARDPDKVRNGTKSR